MAKERFGRDLAPLHVSRTACATARSHHAGCMGGARLPEEILAFCKQNYATYRVVSNGLHHYLAWAKERSTAEECGVEATRCQLELALSKTISEAFVALTAFVEHVAAGEGVSTLDDERDPVAADVSDHALVQKVVRSIAAVEDVLSLFFPRCTPGFAADLDRLTFDEDMSVSGLHDLASKLATARDVAGNRCHVHASMTGHVDA